MYQTIKCFHGKILLLMLLPRELVQKPDIPQKSSDDSKAKIDNIEQRLRAVEAGMGAKGPAQAAVVAASATDDDRLAELERKFAEYAEHIDTMDNMYNTQVNRLQYNLTDLEKEIGEIVERINAGLPAGDTGSSEQGVRELYNKIAAMQAEMENVTALATKLMEDKEERQLLMDTLLEQIELLKTIKANKEDLNDALADKADASTVNKKVSYAQFDAACEDLTRNIEEAVNKLSLQEQMWQQALDDIQQEIGNKLDKLELAPLRDFVYSKLKMLQDRLKALAALKKETEAAGTKSKFLRNVNCISCDRDVIMRKQMDSSLMPPPPSLPPTKSMGPYLAYELDNLRKQQKCAPNSRNMNYFETAMAGAKPGKEEDHICNRYCGGSHTVTTPQQRVARLGHFLQQWGPENQPAGEGEIRGTDGQLYRSRQEAEMIPEKPEIVDDNYFSQIKSRPSMVVQGDIVSVRGGKTATGKAVESTETAHKEENAETAGKQSTHIAFSVPEGAK